MRIANKIIHTSIIVLTEAPPRAFAILRTRPSKPEVAAPSWSSVAYTARGTAAVNKASATTLLKMTSWNE